MNLIYITGTSRGIGAALTQELLNIPDNKVIGIARHQTIYHHNYIHFSIDLADVCQVKSFRFKTPPNMIKVVLVNNAATLGEIAHMGNLSDNHIVQTMHVNLIAPMILINNFIKTYQEAAIEKLIINITSGAAVSAYDGWSAYCASKAGLDMITRVVDAEQAMKKYPIKILGIAPGVVDTDMQEQIRHTPPDRFSKKEKFVALKEQHQLYQPSNVARQLAATINDPRQAGKELISRIVL